MKIYTRTGDKGETSLYGGTRVGKNSPLIDAIGTVDELNASIGLVISLISELKFSEEEKLLKRIQEQLFVLGADLASPANIHKNLKNVRIKQSDITFIERQIDKFDAKLPKMTNFILPGGSEIGASLHLARAICRRAERSVVYANSGLLCRKYLNRLADLLFVLARSVNDKLNVPEIPWLI